MWEQKKASTCDILCMNHPSGKPVIKNTSKAETYADYYKSNVWCKIQTLYHDGTIISQNRSHESDPNSQTQTVKLPNRCEYLPLRTRNWLIPMCWQVTEQLHRMCMDATTNTLHLQLLLHRPRVGCQSDLHFDLLVNRCIELVQGDSYKPISNKQILV